MPRIVDLTLPLRAGSRGIAMEPKYIIERDGWNAATWHIYSHAGTHMDAPIHFAAGPATIEQTPLTTCMGPAWVVQLPQITAGALLTIAHLGAVAAKLQSGESLLLHTGWSRHVDDPALYRDGLPRIS